MGEIRTTSFSVVLIQVRSSPVPVGNDFIFQMVESIMVVMGMGERGRLDMTFRQAKLLDPSNYGVHITVYPNALMVVIDDLKAVGTIQPKLVSAIALEELSKLLKKCCRFLCGNVRRLVPTVLVSPSSRKQKYIEQCDGPIGLRQHVLK